jgi:nucleotidyltransferase substrate binding protein (TIGR01987 family)
MAELNLEPLEKAISQLERGLIQIETDPDNELMRDGVIQRFEYNMDLSWKFIQRYLKDIAQVDEAVIRTKKDLFREAARLKLISDAEAWIAHYEARNLTAHVYDEATAQAVFQRAQLFLSDVAELLKNLRDAA